MAVIALTVFSGCNGSKDEVSSGSSSVQTEETTEIKEHKQAVSNAISTAKSDSTVIGIAIKKCQSDILDGESALYDGVTGYVNSKNEIKTVPDITTAYQTITIEDVAGINAINDRFTPIICDNVEYNPYWVMSAESCIFLDDTGKSIDGASHYGLEDIIKLSTKAVPDSSVTIHGLKMNAVDRVKQPSVINASNIENAIKNCKTAINNGDDSIYNGSTVYTDTLGNERVVPNAVDNRRSITVADVAGINGINDAFRTVIFGDSEYNPYWDADNERCVFLDSAFNNVEALPNKEVYKSDNLIRLNLKNAPDDTIKIDSLKKGATINPTATADSRKIADAINECKRHIASKNSTIYDGVSTYKDALGVVKIVPNIESPISVEDVAGIKGINDTFRDIIDSGVAYSPYWDKINNTCAFLDNKGRDINTGKVYANYTSCVRISVGNAPDSAVTIDTL